MKLKELVYGADAKVNLKLKGTGRLLAGIDVSFRSNLGGNYTYGGAAPTSALIVDFMRPDFELLKNDYVKWSGDLTYCTNVSGKGYTGMFVKLSADCFNPYGNEESRNLTTLGLGFTF